MKNLTNSERTEAGEELAAIRRRPAYHLACCWLERTAMRDGKPRTAEPRSRYEFLTVSWFGNILRRLHGVEIEETTLMVALVDRGFTVRIQGKKEWLYCNLD